MLIRFRRLAALFTCLTIMSGCSSSDPEPPNLLILEQPAIADLPSAPLAKQLTLVTNLNADIRAELVSNLNESFTITFDTEIIFNTETRVEHDLTLLGLRPDRTYTLTVTAETLDGLTASASAPLTFTTEALPADFPVITTNLMNAELMEPTYTLMDTRKKDGSAAYVVVLDGESEVTWYYRPLGTSSTAPLFNGNLLITDETIGQIKEINWRGETVENEILLGFLPRAFYSARTNDPVEDSLPVDAAFFHDDATRDSITLTYFATATNSQSVAGYPLDEFNPAITGTANVRDEPIIEFDFEGTIINSWNFLDILKPTRIGYDGTDGLPEAADWAQVNTVVFDPASNTIIASLRNQDAVVGFSRSNGALLWILGAPANWAGFEEFLLTPAGSDFAWPYHQHAPEISGSGTLLMFDNGNRRASPFTGEPIVDASANMSRAVEYSLNFTDDTVTQVWEWDISDTGEVFYSTTAGDADRLPTTGNTLITFGALCEIGGVPSDDIDNCRTTARVIEVVTGTKERVFEVAVDSQPADSGYTVWRSARLPTLYTNEIAIITPE